MIVNIPQKNFDDPIFLSALNGMLVNLVDVHRPSEVYFIRIDRWFDHKWLGYSGKTRVAFDEGRPWIDPGKEWSQRSTCLNHK